MVLLLPLLFIVSSAFPEEVFRNAKDSEEEENNTVEIDLSLPDLPPSHVASISETLEIPVIPEIADSESEILKDSTGQKKGSHDMFRAFVASDFVKEDGTKIYHKPRPHNLPVEQIDLEEGKMESSAEVKAILFRGSEQGHYIPLAVEDLLPDQCLKHPFEQVVSHPGCDNTTVRSFFCYGLCSSLFVPSKDDIVQSCTCCLPIATQSVAVDLHCPDGDSIRKHVKVVKACSCLPCTSTGVYR